MSIDLQAVLQHEIPLTKAIGIQVAEYTDHSLCLHAPLENNTNHKRTAFGGSLYSVAVLCGWGLIYQLLQRQGLQGQIVIQESNTQFSKPVQGDIVARCVFDSDKQIERFVSSYRRRGIARIQLTSVIEQDGVVAVNFVGRYVVHR